MGGAHGSPRIDTSFLKQRAADYRFRAKQTTNPARAAEYQELTEAYEKAAAKAETEANQEVVSIPVHRL
jgi:hypothetical protein